jgi:hypothetical protein
MDNAARRSARRVKANAAASRERLDQSLVYAARKLGHHGVAAFILAAREFYSASITETYARELLARGGYPNPRA